MPKPKMQSVVTELRCEYRSNPLGIDAPAPRLSWIIQSDRRGERQTAYRILVASTPALLAADKGDLWDSGRIESEQSLNIPYAGQALTSNLVCHWKVRVWSAPTGVEGVARGKASPWSEAAFWTVGLLSENWRAKWITVQMPPTPAAPADPLKRESVSPWLRKTFTLEAAPERALVNVNAVGYFELHVNGEKVGTDVLSPAVSVLSKRTWVMTYDIAAQLRNGKNTIGLWLGRGWNAVGIPGVADVRPRVRLQAEIIADGAQVEIVSDQTWKAMPSSYVTLGPWAWNQYCGERYDARFDNPGWCRAELDDSAWPAVAVIPDAGVPADAQPCPPNRIGKIIPAVRCLDIGNGRYELDFGTNLAGRLKLRIPQLPSGSLVKLFYADWRYATANPEDELTPAGVIKSSGSDMRFPGKDGELRYQVFNQVDEFISAGKDGEIFCSKFNYHGFRCVIVEGLSANPGPACAVAEMIESDLESAGSFACSNDLLNRIHGLNLWTVRCLNLGGYMVDCPHRERLGYGGDGQVSVESCIMNLQMKNLYGKWMRDWIDTQNTKTGVLPFATPYHPPAGDGDFGREGPPAWGGTLPVLAWKTYLYYGDKRILEEAFEPMRLFMERFEKRCVNGIFRSCGDKWLGLGDWVPPFGGMDTSNWPSERANDLFNNCYRIYLWELLEKSATDLGHMAEVARCHAKIAEIRPLIHKEFYDPEKQTYVNDEQASLVMPLLSGVVPEELRQTIMAKLEQNILVRRSGHLDTGMHGTYFLIQYLSEIGRDDLLYDIVNRTTYPGWGYMLSQGATTMWEQWNGFWSLIHACFTSPAGWFHFGLAGIQADPAAPGFKRIIIRPAVIGDLTWVKASHRSPYGDIISEWEIRNGHLYMKIRIPVGATARIHVPASPDTEIFERGVPVALAKNVRQVASDVNCRVFEVDSGEYCFETELISK